MNKRQIQNTAVIAAALGAALASVYTYTNWFSSKEIDVKRERCYNVARAGKNDCATSQHSCASQSMMDRDPEAFIMLPKGLCERIVGGRSV